ncbi:MAG: Serine/threonine protein kinase [Myxococcaceae bacterium]|nr:Serine/threonine protein kinase [Myxococcaceae bacterium]
MIAGFDVIRVLSEGATAELLLARRDQTLENVILEVLRLELVNDATVVKHFHAAVAERRGAEHPGLVRRVGEGWTPDGRPYVISEPVGENLATRLAAGGSMSLPSALQVLESVGAGLRFLHQHGEIHGNIKPATVYVESTPSGLRARLLDCGLALLRPGRSLKIPASRILVEAEYMAPERIRGQRATIASDVYALGVLLFEMLTSFPPFTGTDSNAVRRLHLEGVVPGLPEHLAPVRGLITRCLAKAPEARFASVAELMAAARALSHQVAPDESVEVELVEEIPSEVLGSYKLVEPMGEGAIGRVFRARHLTLQREVAIKVMKPEHLKYPEVVARFVQEAQTVSRIKHEHIVEVFDITVEDARPGQAQRAYIVMELLAGASLTRLIKPGPLEVARIVRIVRQIASALDAAHRSGVVHRDVKPDNIFICDRGGDFAKVLDFGIAKLRGEEPSNAGFAIGTPMYMAPEQARDEQVDHRVDVYALGVVLYRALTGKFPFAGARTDLELFKQILNDVPEKVPATSVGGEPIPEPLRSLVDRCLEKLPEKRPQSMAEISSVLDGLMVREKIAVAPAAPRHRSALLVAGAIAVVGVAGLVFALARPAPATTAVAQPGLSAEVRISVTSRPSGAAVFRADTSERLGSTPLELKLPRAEGVLSLRVEAEGHLPETGEARLDRDQTLSLTLSARTDAQSAPGKRNQPSRKKKVSRDALLDPF